MRTILRGGIAGLVLMGLAGAVLAQDAAVPAGEAPAAPRPAAPQPAAPRPAAPRPAAGPDAPVEIASVAGGVEIRISSEGCLVSELLRAVSAATQRPIGWSDQDKRISVGRVRLSQPIRTSPDRVFERMQGLLVPEEVVLVPLGPSTEPFWYAMDARTLASAFVLRTKATWVDVNEGNVAELEGRDGWFVSTVIPAENLEFLRDARTSLQRMVTSNNIGNVQEVPTARAFVVTDFAPNVASIWRVIQAMNGPGRPPALRLEFFELAHARASDVRALIEGLYPPEQPQRGVVNPNAAPDAPRGGPYVVAGDDGRQLFVRADAEDLESIRRIIAKADRPTPLK